MRPHSQKDRKEPSATQVPLLNRNECYKIGIPKRTLNRWIKNGWVEITFGRKDELAERVVAWVREREEEAKSETWIGNPSLIQVSSKSHSPQSMD